MKPGNNRPELSEAHREHFYTKEDYERSRELRGEEKKTTLGRMIDLMTTSLDDIEDEERREKFRTLVDDITASAVRYIDARISHIRSADSKMKSAIMDADRARRAAHLRLVDSIRIASRNFVKEIDGWGLEEDMGHLVGDSENYEIRERVAQAAIDLIWEMLNEEEYGEQS